KSQVIKTLIDTFRYPRKGPGMMWEACADKIKARGGEVQLGMRVVGCHYDKASELWTVTYESTRPGQNRVTRHSIEAKHAISSAPMSALGKGLSPTMSDQSLQAATKRRYRDFLTVVLILKDKGAFADNWIYIHDPSVKVGRIQNFKSWSPEMVPDPA